MNHMPTFARDQAFDRAVGYENTPWDVATQELMDPNECGLSEDEQRQLFQLMQGFFDWPESDQREMQHDIDRHVIALMRMLSVDLALRSRYASTNSFPPSLETLVPQHLLELPIDPFKGDSFVYRPVAGGSFLLYSTGPKQADHGGTFGPWPSVAAGVADLCLDENDYWQECCVIPTRPGLVSRIAATLQAWRRVWRR